MKTKVIFKAFPTGDIIAMFPEEPGNCSHYTCLSYQLLSEHGSASVDCANLRPAKPEEYAKTFDALVRRGYDLEVVKKFTQKHLQTRKDKINR